ncbi:MAG: zinc ribbon domain-containing protein [Dehalococcoidia bacterium]
MQKNFLCPGCWKENMSESIQCRFCGGQLGVLGALQTKCPSCQWPRVPYDKFCGNCGKPLQPICPNCGNNISKDSRYCPKCSFFCGGGREGLK